MENFFTISRGRGNSYFYESKMVIWQPLKEGGRLAVGTQRLLPEPKPASAILHRPGQRAGPFLK